METVLPQPGFLYTVAMFIAVIGVLVTIHEFGHYLAGRWFGVKAETFSVGFGKELLGFTDRRGTRWKLSALPFGGYVKFAGDLNAASQPGEVDHLPPAERALTLNAKPLWQKAVIVAAGPITNFIFAIAIFAAFFTLNGRPYTPAVVGQIVAGSPAAKAGLQPGDRILSLGGAEVTRFEDVVRVVVTNTGTPIATRIERGGQQIELTLTPAIVSEKDEFGNAYTKGQLGVGAGARERETMGPLTAVVAATGEVADLTVLIAGTLWQVVSGDRSVDELGGPLKIAQVSGQQASLGLASLVSFMALVSINLGFINLLPIPMLDGGHLVLYAIEGVRRRPLDRRVQELAFMSGFAALMTLMLFLTWNDLSSFGVWRQLAGLVG